MTQEPRWLSIARELRAIAQTGLTFTADGFDRRRYERVRELAALLLAQGSAADFDSLLELMRQEKGYATPKVDVRGAAFIDGRILMVRAQRGHGRFRRLGRCQSIGRRVRRAEIAEPGFTARAPKLAAVYY